MKIVILCGGLGTRLREETEYKPKPMVEIGGYPILWHIMKLYAHYGFNEFVLCLGYKGWQIKEYFLNYEAISHDFTLKLGHPAEVEFHHKHEEAGWKITFVDTGQDAMTGARIRKIKPWVENQTFMLTYGDGLARVPLDKLLSHHRRHKKISSVTAVRPPGRFGEMVIESDRVVEFNEKPQVTEGYINGGFFVLEPRIFDYLEGGDDLFFEKGPLMELTRDGELAPFCFDGFWQPMDTYRELQTLNKMWESGNAPWKIW